MSEKSRIPLFIHITVGIILAQLIMRGIPAFLLYSNFGKQFLPTAGAQVDGESQRIVTDLLNVLRGFHVETLTFPKTLAETGFSSEYIFHSVEINPIDNNNVVFKILPFVDNAFSFSGMLSYNESDRFYQILVCQSDQKTRNINFPESITQCPPNSVSIKDS